MLREILFQRNKNGTPEWAIIELQGDLKVTGDQSIAGQFIGDLCYTKFGQPILIIGHHILQGKEQKMDKTFAVLEKSRTDEGVYLNPSQSSSHSDEPMSLSQQSDVDANTTLNSTMDRTLLDTTVAIEHKTRQITEYKVKAIVTKKIIFKGRPKPIIENVAKHV